MQYICQISGDLGQVLINYSNLFWIPGIPEVLREEKIIIKHGT